MTTLLSTKEALLAVAYYVYILYGISYCKTHVGDTGDLISRLASHNKGHKEIYNSDPGH